MAGTQSDQYTKIPNDILEKIMESKLNGTQVKLIMAVCRFTFGFQRESAELSISFLSEATGINPRNIRRELEILTRRNIILAHSEQHGTRARTIGINKEVNQWLERVKSPPLDDVREGQLTPSENIREGQLAPPREGEFTPSREGQLTPQEIKKENYKENIYSISARKVFSVWNEQGIISHRELTEDISKAITSSLKKYGLEKVVLAVQRYAKMYHDPGYFFSYKWTLINFLSRKKGLPDFLDGGEKWENYQARGQPKTKFKAPVDDLGDPVPGAQDMTPI
ncbi:MAG TPA: hypothetical protein DG577_00255 [Firmicutes bacterium]|nr:hypothetical protein [Bacillota bacterium]